MKKRVLSMFMALALCLTLLPTAVFADVTENGEGSGGTHYVAESGGTQYETVQEILENMEEGEITLLGNVTENLTVYAATTIHMNGHSITGNIDATDSLTLNGGTVDGTVTVDAMGGTFTMTAPAEAEAAITGGLNVVFGSAFVSGAQVGVKGTLYFDGTDMLISGAVKAVELDSAAEPAAKTLYGSATVNGDTAAEAGFDTDTYKVGGEIAKKLTNKQVGSTTPAAPSLTLTETSKSLTAGKTAVFTANYTGTDTLNAYVQGSAVNGYFTISQKNNGDGTYTVSVKIDEETPGGTYTLFVHELGNTSVQASATITVTGLPDAAEVNGKQYKSLPRALNAAQDGDTVKLLADHVTDADALNALGEDFTFEQYASIVPVVTKTLTLDLNHKTVDYLEVGFTETNEETQKKETLATGNLTVTGEGAYGRISNLMFMAGALDIRSGEIGGSGCAGLLCDANSGSVTVSNGTVYGLTVLEGASVTVNGGSNHAGEWVVASSATLNITDGTFGDVQFTRNGTIAISGGTFQSIKSYIAEELQPLMSLLDTQKVHAFYKGDDVQDGNATELTDVTVKEHTHTMVNNKCACGLSCTHTNTEGASTIGKDGKCTACGTQFAAVIGETYYTDVKSALNAAADGQTVKLLANEMLPDGIYVSKTLTLDLDGHSLDGYSLNVGGLTPTSQVRTGNLTVIDSSGGNGAVGVTVRDGGTLVFDPKNDHTTLLQLEVWGGTVELYGGKILRSGLRLNNNITLGDLLPQKAGLAYYRDNTQLTLEEAASQTCDLVVKLCSHGGKNGFDKNAATCPNCNAPAVAETDLNNGEGNRPQRRFADLQTALDADRDGGAELTLLTDVTGDYTIDGTKNTKLDLNGHSIKGTVTVKAAVGSNTTTLSNRKNTTTARIDKVVAHSGAELARPDKPAVIGTLTLAEGATWKTILSGKTLGYKVLNADGTHKWYARDDVNGSQLNNVIINILPITFEKLNLEVDGQNLTGNSLKVERGTTVQLCASCNKDAEVTFSIKQDGATTPITLSGNDVKYTTVGTSTTLVYVAEYIFNDVGSYTISFTAAKDGYTVTSTPKMLTVTKPNLSNAEITFPNGNEAAFNYWDATGVPTFIVTYKGQTLEKDVDFTITSGDSFSGVGPCTLTIKATDDGDYTGSKSAQWNVRPLKVAASVGDIIKTYDGTTDLPKNTKITFKSADSYYTGTTLRLAKGTDYEVSNARYDSADAGQKKTVSFTIKLKNAGYVFEDGTTQKDFTLNGADFDDKTFQINKATAPKNNPTGTLNIINGTCQTYTYDFNNILPGLPKGKYGTISYGQADISLVSQSGYYYDETIVEFKKGVLTLAQFYAKDGNMTGKIGTVKVNVTTTNYENFQLKLVLYAVDQIKPVPDGTITAMSITYGDTLSKSEISGKMKDRNTGKSVNGTFAWTDGTIKPAASDNYEAEWTFTPAAGYEKYATVTGTVTIKVKPAKLIVSVKASSMYYTGEEQIASIIASGQSVDSTPVTFTYSDKVDGNYTSGVPTFTDAGTYTAYYKAEAANHEPATGTFTVTIDPLPISLLSVSSISKTYDGSADVTLTADKLTFFSKTANIKLPDTALSFSDAQFTSKQEDGSYLPSPEVGNGKALSFTMTLTSNNYVFEGKSEGTTKVSDVFATDDVNRFTITKAAAPTVQPVELTVINGLAKTYLVNLPALPTLGDNCKYGSIKYEACNFDLIGEGGYANSTAMITSNDEFQLTVPAVESQTEGSVGTVGVKITTDNYQDMLLTVEVIAKNKIVPVLDGEITATPITYGDTLSKSEISGKMKDPNTGAKVEGTFSWQQPGDTILDASTLGHSVEWTFTPAAGYEEYATATGTVTVKVNKADPTFNAPTAQENLTYTGQEQALITAGSVTDYGPTMQYSLTENGTYSQNIPTGTDAGTYNVWYRVFGDANHNDTKPASVAVRIGQKPLTITGVTAASKPYDGTTNADISSVTFDNVTLNRGTDYTVTANFDDASVDSGKNITATVTLMEQAAKNYALEQSSFPTTGSITKAAAPTNIQSGTLTITNGLHKTYSFDLSTLLPKLTAPCDYGTITYDKKVDTNLGVGSFITLVNGKTGELTLEANRSGTDEGQFGTITVTISTSNYQDITLTVNIFAKNKLTPVMDGKITASKITYGQALSDSSITGKMKDPNTGDEVNGTFTWTDGTIKPDANDRYEAEWTFTPDSEEYATVTDTATVEVAPKSIEGAVITLESADLEYNAAEQSPKITGVALEKWTENITYRIVSGNTATNVNDSLTLTIEGTGNYTGKAAVKWKITPKTVTPTIEVEPCTYTGDALEPTVTLKDGNEVIPTDEYTVEYSNNTNAGTGRVTIKDVAGGNYVIKEKTQDFTITKAAAPTNIQSGTLTITNGLHKTYSFDLSTLLPKLTAPCDYGTITYDKKVDTNLGVGSFITLVNGKTGELTLDANRSGTDEGQFGTITVTVSTSNYQDIILTINVIAKNRITPTGTPTLSKNAITYGDALNTIALSGKLHDNVNNVDVDGTFEWVDGTHIPVVGNGTYAAEWIFEPTDTEKYLTVSGRSNITVEKAQQYGKLSMAGYTYGKTPSTPTLTDRTGDLNAQVTYSYAAAGSGSVQTWDIQNPPALNAGTYRMYASIGDTDNYYGFEAVYCEFVVAKATPTYTVPTGLTAKYGQTLADVTLPDGWSWTDSSESVGGASTAAKTFQAKFTPTDAVNYNMVENIGLEVMVNKADGGNLKTVELEQKYTDASDHTYTPDWAGLPAGQDWTFSSEASIVLSKQDFAADGSLLTYAISGGKAGDKITITLKASCDNYEDFTITLNVTLTEKDDQKPLTITGAGSVVYGQTLTLTTTGGSGTGTVTYRIDTDASTGEATIDPETGVLTPVKVGSVSVIATKAGDNDYNDVTSAPFVLMIKPATPTGEPNYTKITTSGKTLKDTALTTKGSTLNPSDGKLEWVDDKGEPLPDDTTVKANTTYKWRFTPDDDNYTTLTGEVELYHKSSSGGGWYDSYYTIKATAGAGGSISPSGSVSVREGRDQTFTITPDKSYAVSNVKIDGKSIGAVKSYTFENVRRTHTIEVIFMKANGNPQTGVFVDVATGSYYEDAVDWAVENGITQGTDDTHFVPDGICTRAQAVAFLWRAAGSPKPETCTMPFADVPAGSYYYDAVLWAVENGIAKGTSDTTFSPNMTCSRAQIVTFLWRSEKSPAAGTANPFADVKSTAYYADAVLWAVKENIAKGTTNTTFSPDADCTRAQIVTFLWRCKK